jgi:futalosine hydrolase
MEILLVTATEQEINRSLFADRSILISGAGMVDTTLNLTKHLSKNTYDLVVNIGIAGSFNNLLMIGDVVEVVEDNFSEIGFEDGESFSEFTDFEVANTFRVEGRTNLKQVKAITVNTVHGNENSITEIVNRFKPDLESMEGAAVFVVCKEFNIPCVQIRSISNKVEKRNKENWNIPLAIQNLNTTVAKIIIAL